MGKSWHSHVVAVTGTIGSGKSTFVQCLRELGAFVISADDLSHEAIKKGSDGWREVVQEFGQEILAASGEIDRAKLGSKVFAVPDSSEKKRLERILHPIVARMADERFQAAIAQGVSPLIYEIPLLFEAGLQGRGFKSIVLVASDPEVCIQRVMSRNGLERDKVLKRVQSQLSAEWKATQADVVIDNSGSLEELKEKARQFFELLSLSPTSSLT